MKILYHHRTQGRNVERVHILGVVNALRQLGHLVDIISVPGVSFKETKDSGITKARKNTIFSVVSSRLHGAIFELMEIIYNLIVFIRIPFFLIKKEYHFIYERYSLFMFATVLVCKIIKKPIILEINDSVLVPRVRTCHLIYLARIIEKWTFKNASGLVIISTTFKDIIENNYGKISNYVISPNAVNLDDFPEIEKIEINSLREKLGLNDNDIVCGFIGAFHEWHGVHWFVDLLLDKLNDENELKILMVGDGSLLPVLRAAINKRGMASKIILTGRVPHSDINKYLSVMNFSVMPDSNIYGSPMKIFEYMAKHLPVVAPSYAPISDVISNNKTGWLTPVGDHEELVNRLIQVSKDKTQLSIMGSNAFNYIKNNRQWSNNATQIFELLNNVSTK